MKKLLAVSLCICMLLALTVPASALNKTTCDYEDELNLYDHHTYEPQNYSTQSNARGQNSIDGAIAFVKALNLEDQGYGYISEQCLDELEMFRDNHFELESYTVLTPKATAAEQVFGTYNGRTFYYTLTSMTRFAKENDTGTVDELGSKISRFIQGAINLIVAIPGVVPSTATGGVLSVSYAAFCNAVGIQKYNMLKGAFFRYRVSYDVSCRSIYAYATSASSSKRICYKDYSGIADANLRYYHNDPAHFSAANDSILIDAEDDISVQSSNYENTDRIVQIANSYFNRGEVCVEALKDPYVSWK